MKRTTHLAPFSANMIQATEHLSKHAEVEDKIACSSLSLVPLCGLFQLLG